MIGIAAISIGVATIVLALSYALGGLWAWIFLVGGLWQYGLRRHWSWVASLALVCFVSLAAGGLLLATAALEIRIKFSLGIAFLLGLLAIWGLSRASRFLRREGD
jgi:hypothetical protein